jgi:hypothetical protein
VIPARNLRCVFTGLPGDSLHHLSGTGEDGKHFDRHLVMPLLLQQHSLEHQQWRILGIGDASGCDPAVLRLRRIGCFLARLGEHHGPNTIVLPGDSVLHLGRSLWSIADYFEDRT